VAEVVRRADPEAVRRILASVPAWFGIEEANASYVADAGRLPSYLAVDGDDVVGVALLSEHFPSSRELHLIAVHADHHRRGVGRALVDAVEADLRLGACG
jgi:GNAT superfamily N-acetyltransferase